MKIKILHLFPDLMNLYGEYANVTLLTKYMNEEGLETEVVKSNDVLPFDGFSVVYIGCGTERASLRALELLSPIRDEVADYVSKGGFLLLTGNAYEIFGHEIIDMGKRNTKGLGIFDYTVFRASGKRYLGDRLYTDVAGGQNIIGFMNKCAYNDITENYLFNTHGQSGNGENTEGEGFISGNTVASSLLGPLFVRNPYLCRWYLDRLYGSIGSEKTAEADMSLQTKAFDAAYKELCELKKKQK
ncbi:MAG: hypothetical protein KBT31_00625 [Firmicutes bacterium]|nr:hypothetical protein [Candidatus Colimorpha enterica]